jgi:hypothetical protein
MEQAIGGLEIEPEQNACIKQVPGELFGRVTLNG